MYKECKFGPVKTCQESFDQFVPNLADYYAAPFDYWMEPYRICGNLYYVGDKKLCMYLIDTGEGLILFDTGYGHALHLLLESIRRLGYAPEDVKYIIHTHGHFDHFGGGDELRKLYGCKIFMSAADTKLLREMPERALIHLGPVPFARVCWPDVEIQDGDMITLGNTSIRCVLAPGHTFGTMAFFFDVTEGDTTYKVGYWGGVGFLTLYREHCRNYGLPETKCELLRQSILKMRNETVDIVLGNHPPQNCTVEKRQWMIEHPGTNPFINPNSWNIFLDGLEERRAEFEALGY